jgi:hypothetical protein
MSMCGEYRCEHGLRWAISAALLGLGLVACGSGPNQAQTGATDSPVSARLEAAVAAAVLRADGSPRTPTVAIPGSPPMSDAGRSGPGSGPSVVSAARELTGNDLEAVLALRYEAYWDVFDAARRAPSVSPEVDFPALAALAAGDQLDLSYQSLVDLARAGQAIREPTEPRTAGSRAGAEHRVRVDGVDGTVALLSGCVVNDDVREVVGNGAVLDDGVKTVRSTATMALAEGQWKLIRSQAVQIDDGVTGCWLSPADEFPY